MTSDAGDERAKNKRGNNDFNEAEKNIAEDAQVGGKLRMIEANFETHQHGEEDPKGEGALGESGDGEKGEGKPTEPEGECVAGREDQ